MIMVTGIPSSSRQALLRQLTALGTDLLQAQPNQDGGTAASLPQNADVMARGIGPATHSSAVANAHQSIRRTDRGGTGRTPCQGMGPW
ncbi:hypothetical protein ACFY2Z_13485 [Streptomyces sp. NPDC001222]|uniref:hypothetical protein n=1 Tax=Streptomyces sp. NPDC001222 TaxID=3364548 RepID=UPI00367FB570